MTKRLLLVVFLAASTSACAPVMQRSAQMQATCAPALATAIGEPVSCQSNQHNQRAAAAVQVPTGPGNKDVATWLVVLTMGFAALYLMAFR